MIFTGTHYSTCSLTLFGIKTSCCPLDTVPDWIIPINIVPISYMNRFLIYTQNTDGMSTSTYGIMEIHNHFPKLLITWESVLSVLCARV